MPHVLSFSGMGPGLTPKVYRATTEKLEKKFPGTFEFLGSPFAGAGFSFPLVLTEEENCLDTTSRLILCWYRMNEFNCKKLLPALARGKIIVVNRYGLDAFIYSRSMCVEKDVCDEIEAAHHALVRLRVLAKKIPPPRYIVPWVGPKTIGLITPEWIKGIKALKGVDAEGLRSYIQREQEVIEAYCDPEKGQKRPWKINAGLTVEEMGDAAVEMISHRIERLNDD